MNILLNKHFKILDFDTNTEFNKDNIKECYKKIALCCHPDKLNNIKDEKEKEAKIEKFKEATVSYNYLLKYLSDGGGLQGIFNNFDDYSANEDIDITQYFNMFKDFKDFSQFDDAEVFEFNFGNEENIKKSVFSTMTDLASMFLKQNIKPKSYYNPTNSYSDIGATGETRGNIIKHNIELPVTIKDIYSNKKKKLELILKKVKEPVNLEVYCGYSEISKQYIDDDGIEHDIIINLKIVKNNKHKILKNYNHIERYDGSIDIITTIEISLLDYLEGSVKKLVFIDGSIIKVNIPAFENDKIIKKRRGLYGGNLIINIYLKNIISSEWNALDKDSKDNMIRILKTI